ncbi:MAG TPA: glycosyltransferase family 4 protein [Solirubrobacterales bacterium]|jgi:glycosyltransferase involved in cell wall biosynthesis|nr:glycosyltransferase family 4 protein [Solirubrobacterales bacterium]
MRLLIVAAPMISRGGVYSWLGEATPILRAADWTVGVLWAARVEATPASADWEARVEESGGRLARVRALPQAVDSAVADFAPDRVLSVLPQSDLACARSLRGTVPWAAMVHGRPYPAPGEGGAARRLGWRAAVKWAYGHADRVFAVSDALAETLREDLELGQVTTVHNGVEIPPAAELRPRPGRTVGFLGRLSTEKAPDLFLEAVRGVECDARVFGDGPLLAQTRAQAAAMPRVTIEGWTDRDLALEAIDLLMLSSRREAFPLACIEAGARGIPILARDVGGIREVLDDDPELGRHCLLPASASPAEFGARLTALLDDTELRLDLGRRLRQTVSERFALPGQVHELGRLLSATAPAKSAGSL